MQAANLPPGLPAAWDKWRISLAALARGAPEADGGGLDEAWAELEPLVQEAQGCYQAGLLSVWELFASSLPAVLEDTRVLCGAACRRPQLRAPAVTALRLLTKLPSLPAVDGSSPERVPGIVASKPYIELSRFFLQRSPALVRQAVAEAGAARPGVPAGPADTLCWAGDLGSRLLYAMPHVLCQPIDEALPTKQLQRGVASWMDAASEAWEAGALVSLAPLINAIICNTRTAAVFRALRLELSATPQRLATLYQDCCIRIVSFSRRLEETLWGACPEDVAAVEIPAGQLLDCLTVLAWTRARFKSEHNIQCHADQWFSAHTSRALLELLCSALAEVARPLRAWFCRPDTSALATSSDMLCQLAHQWAVQCSVWALYWTGGDAGEAANWLSLASVEQLLYAAASAQRIAEALLAGAPASHQDSGGPGGGAEEEQPSTTDLLQVASVSLVLLASNRLSIVLGPASEPFPWQPWQQCMVHLTQLLRGLAWEAERPTQRPGMEPLQATAAEPHGGALCRQAWTSCGAMANALRSALSKPVLVSSAEVPAVLAVISELARVLAAAILTLGRSIAEGSPQSQEAWLVIMITAADTAMSVVRVPGRAIQQARDGSLMRGEAAVSFASLAAAHALRHSAQRVGALATVATEAYVKATLWVAWLLALPGTGPSALIAGAPQLLRDSCWHQEWGRLGGWRAPATSGIAPAMHADLDYAEDEARQLCELSQTSGQALKLCCAALDGIAGTRFAAQEAEIEGSGRALMRELLQSGATGAADAVRQHVWRRRATELLPQMELAVRQGAQWGVCTPCAEGSGGAGGGSGGPGGGNGSGGGWRVLCPLAAVERDASGLACTRPGCVALPAEAGPCLRCRGCGLARYCCADCGQADWPRHRRACKALRLLRAGAAEVRPAAQLRAAARPGAGAT